MKRRAGEHKLQDLPTKKNVTGKGAPTAAHQPSEVVQHSTELSEADMDHYKFLMELNQQTEIGFTENDILSLIQIGSGRFLAHSVKCACSFRRHEQDSGPFISNFLSSCYLLSYTAYH